ncbi:MAG: transporter substrate-binding domain-containing protein [Hyphomicrobiales bacterium]|nr:transporter substrate-binding domain-containing protein [Hyphomicrobiales bacterium]
MTVFSFGRVIPRLAATIVALIAIVGPTASVAETDPLSLASDGRVLPVLKSGWYFFRPYQFMDTQGSGGLTGIDVRIAQEFARRLGYFVEYEYHPWAEQIAAVRGGTLDFVSAATPTAERAVFAYFTTTYRAEEMVLLVPADRQLSFSGLSDQEVINRFKSEGLRLGVTEGFVYGSEILNAYVAENSDSGLVVPTESSVLNLRRLLAGEIDGMVDDRLTAVTTIASEDAFGRVAEIRIESFSDVSLMFSKANFSPELIAAADAVITEMKEEGVIEEINTSFMLPLFLSQTTNSDWYWLVDVVGTTAFALSGTILGWRIRANIAGFFILSALPAVGGGMMRDVLLDRPIASLQSAQNITIITVISLVGYVAYRIYSRRDRNRAVHPAAAGLFNLFDAVGLGSFTVTGIAVTLSDPHGHSFAWAPFVGTVTAAGGGIVRDALVQRRSQVLFDDVYTQISLFWGAVLTVYLAFTPVRIEPGQYGVAVWATVLVIIVTRILWLRRRGNLFSL